MSKAAPPDLTVRPMRPGDLPEVMDVWVAAWQAAYPSIDFEARRGWITNRIAELERKGSRSLVLLGGGRIIGALVVNPETGYVDQIVVGIEVQGFGAADVLLAEARRLSPAGLDLHVNRDNARALGFYQKHGFKTVGEDVNPRSGAAVYKLSWRP